ncbi:MAG: membrane protein [Herpetosiphonaceae bacterium]|nr:MAG: membrane protein [Herpetosiphonaceae bacterium]
MATPQRVNRAPGFDPHGTTGRSSLPVSRPLTPSEFNTAVAHLYRGEVSRANTWRMRLDGTTNWAVLTTGATLSFAFSSPQNTHVMILLNSLLIFFFLFIEARRYRFYDIWRARVRVMETEFFASLLAPNQAIHEDSQSWRDLLALDLVEPRFNVSLWEAMGRRLRRNYVWIFVVLAVSWMVKVTVHPFPPPSIQDLYNRVAIGPIPSWFVLLFGVVFNTMLIILAVTTVQRGSESDEVLSRSEARERMGPAFNIDRELPKDWWE